MSSSSSSATSYRLSNIAAIVRRANERVSRLAASVRNSLKPTHHAKQRAQNLRLSVDIKLALKLNHAQVSVVPLPVLERPAPQHSPVPAPLPVPVIAPEPVVFRENEISRAVVGREREMQGEIDARRPKRPVLRCEIPSDIVPGDEMLAPVSAYGEEQLAVRPESVEHLQAPVVLRGQNVPWRPVTSRWSISTTSSEVGTDLGIDAAVHEEEEENPRYSQAYEGTMDLPITISPDSPEGPYGELEYAHPRLLDFNVGGDTRRVVRPPRHLVVPLILDETRLSWGSDMTGASSSSGSSSSSSSRSSSSTSSVTSGGPETPTSSQPKLMIRIKRSIPSDLHIVEDPLEKRPKYGRKPWAVSGLVARRQSSRIMTMTTRSSNRF